MPPYIPPSASALEADTDKAIAGWSAALKAPDPWTQARTGEIDGIAAIIAAQFPGIPAATLGRVLASASMAIGSICSASEVTGEPLSPWDLAAYLGFAGTRLAMAGGEIDAMEAP